MKDLRYATTIILALACLASTALIRAADKPKSIDFAGWLTELNLETNTIAVKGKKVMVFAINLQKCSIFRNGNGSTGPSQWGGLKNARVGDAVIGRLSLRGPTPVVVRLEFTADPRFGLPIPGKPGFITTPYTSAVRMPLDVRGYARGAMIKDPASGKIILIP